MPGLISLLVTLILVGCIVWLAFWVVDLMPLPDPPKAIVKVVIGLIVLLYLLGVLAGFAPYPSHFYR